MLSVSKQQNDALISLALHCQAAPEVDGLQLERFAAVALQLCGRLRRLIVAAPQLAAGEAEHPHPPADPNTVMHLSSTA